MIIQVKGAEKKTNWERRCQDNFVPNWNRLYTNTKYKIPHWLAVFISEKSVSKYLKMPFYVRVVSDQSFNVISPPAQVQNEVAT